MALAESRPYTSRVRLRIVKWILAVLFLVALVITVGMMVSLDFQSHDARLAGSKAQIDSFLVALDYYRSDVGAFPKEEQGLAALRVNPGVKGWGGPYLLSDVPDDPWGKPYRYRIVGGRPQITAQSVRR